MGDHVKTIVDIHVSSVSLRNEVLKILEHKTKDAVLIHKLRTNSENERIIYTYTNDENNKEALGVLNELLKIRETRHGCEFAQYLLFEESSQESQVQACRTYPSQPLNDQFLQSIFIAMRVIKSLFISD